MENNKTPYFILETKKLRENFKEFDKLCKRHFSSYKIAYSVKTNSLREVLEVLNDEKSGFEVASLNELKVVRNFKAFKIFNSPCKTESEIEEAIRQKALINIDSLGELNKHEKLGVQEVGVRIAFINSKFGIETNKINGIVPFALTKEMKIVCLSSHPGTQRSINDYEEYLKKWKEFLENTDLKEIKFIDIGGGFPDKTQLKNLGARLEDYFALISKDLGEFLKDKTLILEPGRAIVSDAMGLVTKVHYIKENFGKKYAILDAGINLLPKITLASYKFNKLIDANKLIVNTANDAKGGRVRGEGLNNKKSEKFEDYILAGPLLFSNDILGKFHGNLKEGDLLKVENVGAYCINLSWEISFGKARVELRN